MNTTTRREIKTTPYKTTNTTPHSDDEITKKTQKKLNICKNHLFRSKEREKKDVEG